MNDLFSFSRFIVVVGGLFLAFATGGAHAATLNVQSGHLYGANGVVVNGVAYDVAFVDGTCASVFSGCDDAGDFTFNTHAEARQASLALDSLFLDGALGLFDSLPDLTNGCSGPSEGLPNVCDIFTVFLADPIDVTGVVWHNSDTESEDGLRDDVFGIQIKQYQDTGSMGPNLVFAKWTPSVSVPEPASFALVAAALIILGISTRKRVNS